MRLEKRIVRPTDDSRGQTMAEYAMILATIAAVSVGLVKNAGTIVTTLVSHVTVLF